VESLLDTRSSENILDHLVWEALTDLSGIRTQLGESVQLGVNRTEVTLPVSRILS
jgi:hypothetical protein